MVSSLFFLAGLLIGSFVNVINYRLPKGLNAISDRSKCISCNSKIPFYLNIPVISYLILKGKSKCCNSQISIRYPIVELLIAFIFLINSMIMSEVKFAIVFSLISVIIISIIIIDYSHKIIFDFMSFSLILFGLTCTLLPYNLNPFEITFLDSLIASLFSMFLFWFLRFLFFKFKKIEALGKGDIYLIGGLSSWIGFIDFVYLLSVSSIAGIILYLLQNKTKNYEVPFGSALGVGFLLIAYAKLF